MKIHFLGAVETVTGSCFLLQAAGVTFLMECGLFQGDDWVEAKNREPFAFDPGSVDFMILSHAHIDHSGRIPLLVREGFSGPVYCTKATADLSDIMLRDSANIQEFEARDANERNKRRIKREMRGRSARKEALQELTEEVPLYTLEDAKKALKQFRGIDYGETFEPAPGVSVRFLESGHLLGSSIVEVWVTEKGDTTKLVYTGDLGRRYRPILRDPATVDEADILLLEATYGDRLHEKMEDSEAAVKQILVETLDRGGNVIIPSFAVGRTQELIYLFNQYSRQGGPVARALDGTSIYVDSPMATSATEVFRRHPELFDEETKTLILSGITPLDFDKLDFTRTKNQSIALNYVEEAKIIISSSGMCEAGRILHHLKHNLTDPDASIVMVGFQAPGTLGRQLRDGASSVELFGETVPVLAQIHVLDGFSGHADYEDLLEWLGALKTPPRCMFLVHGEDSSKEAFAVRVQEELGWDCVKIPGREQWDLQSPERKIEDGPSA